jgi:hypothetical protein
MLHDKYADIVSGTKTTYGISHMKTHPLLPDYNSSDINLGGRFNDGINRISDNEFDALPL